MNDKTIKRPSMDHPPIRVMHVVDFLALAGMEYGVIKLVNRLDPNRFYPMICCLSSHGSAARPLLENRIPVFELGRRAGRDFRLILKLASLFRHQRVEIVHSHNWQTLFYAVTAAVIARVPIIIHGEHGHEDRTVSRRQLLLKRLLAKGVNYLTAVSSGLAQEMVHTWKVPAERVAAISNGVDLELFSRHDRLDSLREEFELTDENRVILNIGGLRTIKDHPTLIRAFARAYQKVPDARLMIVGEDYGSGIQKDLEKLAEALGIRKSIHFVGARHDIPRFLSLCDVYVNTSLFEGMSNTILEAMASRRPVIATEVGGNPELVEEGVTGFLIPPGDDVLLADRLKLLLEDADLLKKLGEAGRRKVASEHPISGMVRNYSTLYQEIYSRIRFKAPFSLRSEGKRWMAKGIRSSGLGLLKERIETTPLTILTYHRVLPYHEALGYPFQGMIIRRDIFEAQVAYLARYFRVLAFPEAIRLFRKGRLPRRAVVVTFDDGYRDNYEYAWPILKKYQIPATFFVVTGALDKKVRLWWDEVAEDVQKLWRNPLAGEVGLGRLPGWMKDLLRQLDRAENPHAITQELVHRLNKISLQERLQALKMIHTCSNIDSKDRSDLMLTWDQARLMLRGGMNFGTHTATHAFLDELSPEEVRWELRESIERLQSELGTTISALCYPRGRVKDHLKEFLQDAGIEVAVSTESGVNRLETDLYQLNRIDAGYCCPKNYFNSDIFEAELQGWFNFFHRG